MFVPSTIPSLKLFIIIYILPISTNICQLTYFPAYIYIYLFPKKSILVSLAKVMNLIHANFILYS